MSPSLKRFCVAALALATSAATGCGDSTETVRPPLNLERPVDLAFACFGGLRLVGSNGIADPDDEVVISAQPMDACRLRSLTEPERSVGQEDLEGESPVPAVNYFTFIVQSVPGTVAVATFATKSPEAFTGIDVNFVDADPLTPGRNSVVVGSLPVAIAADRDGCHMITANSGSCDLSVVDINAIVDEDESTPPDVRTLEVTNTAGAAVIARPAAMIAEPAAGIVGGACSDDPQGLIYVAYPDCHLVAAVRASTGEIEAGISFDPLGVVTITDGNVSCPAQCGGGGTLVAGERPVTIDVVHDPRVDTRRLVIGSEDSSFLTVVELDAGYLPTSFSRIALEGDVGVLDVALTPQIGMGGSTGSLNDDTAPGGQFQFIYAVASDATVRVADILGINSECDTQVDPRYLRGETSIGFMACMPVGGLTTPPRRSGAQGPGIELVAASTSRADPAQPLVPLAVAVVAIDAQTTVTEARSPDNLIGHFAFVTAATGETVIINIDDDFYGDIWSSVDPLGTQVPLALPHQVRDSLTDRDSVAETTINGGTDDEEIVPVCDDNGPEGAGSPRLGSSGIAVGFDRDEMNVAKTYALPGLRRILCVDGSNNDEESPISELSFSAPRPQRDAAFPDLRALRIEESFNMAWEGSLSRDDIDQSVDGPVNRAGLVEKDGSTMTIRDGSRPFCALGTEVFDIAVLVGCDPSLGDAQCGLDEICYVHPEATVASGSCLPADDADRLAGTCRDFLTSRRRYSITGASSDELRVVPRRHVLTTSPLDGCTSDDQCQVLAAYEASLATPEHPLELIDSGTVPPTQTYSCEADPTRAPGPDRCVMTCDASADCDDGTICQGGYCVEGVLPPAACAPGVQRYQVRAGDAYSVVGSVSGFRHPIIADSTTGACIKDVTAHPLQIGRLPLTAQACTGDGLTDLTPNPCSITLPQTERVPDYVGDGTCDLDTDDGRLITRDAPMIRFRNPGITFHLVDPWYPGDALCREDRGGLPDVAAGTQIPMVHLGNQLEVPIIAGFSANRVGAPAVFPINVIRGPENSIWVIDEGDNVPDGSSALSTRGQVFRIEGVSLGTVNVVQ